MQAIQESNRNLKEARDHYVKVQGMSEETKAYFKMHYAEIKANQALAYALLDVANAIRKKEHLDD